MSRFVTITLCILPASSSYVVAFKILMPFFVFPLIQFLLQKENYETSSCYYRKKSLIVLKSHFIVGSNPTGGMDVCVCSVCVFSVST
jgi:hypothetical protein